MARITGCSSEMALLWFGLFMLVTWATITSFFFVGNFPYPSALLAIVLPASTGAAGAAAASGDGGGGGGGIDGGLINHGARSNGGGGSSDGRGGGAIFGASANLLRGGGGGSGGLQKSQRMPSAPQPPAGQTCAAWLPAADAVPRRRDFAQAPVVVVGMNDRNEVFTPGNDNARCDVPCYLYPSESAAKFAGRTHVDGYGDGISVPAKLSNVTAALLAGRLPAFRVARNMESAGNYLAFNLDRWQGKYDILSHTNLDSHVPAMYGSWREFNFMTPPSPKNVGVRASGGRGGRRRQHRRLLAADGGGGAGGGGGDDAAAAVEDVYPLASAFISNCNALSRRGDIIDELRRHGVGVDLYGQCNANAKESDWPDAVSQGRDRAKFHIMKAYPFHLAFENTKEPGYVTEKFFGPLSAGTVPVVLGAPDIALFAPQPDALLYIAGMDDVPRVAAQMKALAAGLRRGETGLPAEGEEPTGYKKMLAYKVTGVSDGFKALTDITVVHSTCRICLRIADAVRRMEKETFLADAVAAAASPPLDPPGVVAAATLGSGAAAAAVAAAVGTTAIAAAVAAAAAGAVAAGAQEPVAPRPCRCFDGGSGGGGGESAVVHHLFVRERGSLEFFDLLLAGDQLTLAGLTSALTKELTRRGHVPLWTLDRDARGATVKRHPHGGTGTPAFDFRVYRVYPANPTTTVKNVLAREAAFASDDDVAAHVLSTPCPELEVVLI